MLVGSVVVYQAQLKPETAAKFKAAVPTLTDDQVRGPSFSMQRHALHLTPLGLRHRYTPSTF